MTRKLGIPRRYPQGLHVIHEANRGIVNRRFLVISSTDARNPQIPRCLLPLPIYLSKVFPMDLHQASGPPPAPRTTRNVRPVA